MLAGEQTLDEIVLNSWDRYIDDHITLHAGKKVVEVHRVKRIVRANDGTEAEYDRLSAPAAIAVGPKCGTNCGSGPPQLKRMVRATLQTTHDAAQVQARS